MTISATETACDVYESALGCRDRGVIYRIVWVCYGVGSEGSALLFGVSGVVLHWFLLDICQSRYAPLEFVHEGFSLYIENPGALISLLSMFVLPSELHLSCDCKPALKHSEISLFPIANPKRIKLIFLDEALLWKPCSNSTARQSPVLLLSSPNNTQVQTWCFQVAMPMYLQPEVLWAVPR